jgi:hypothetical protein
MSTPELVMEIQDGSPDRRLAALAVIDLAEVAQETIEDWIRNLPAPEANELAGAIPAQRPHASCDEDLRWAEIAEAGYSRRHLPTFLVMLTSSLEAMDAKGCPGAANGWRRMANWLVETYDAAAGRDDEDCLGDLMLFVFEEYVGHQPIFEAFCELLARHESLALEVSTDPERLLCGLSADRQRAALVAAEGGGGLPLKTSWAALMGNPTALSPEF